MNSCRFSLSCAVAPATGWQRVSLLVALLFATCVASAAAQSTLPVGPEEAAANRQVTPEAPRGGAQRQDEPPRTVAVQTIPISGPLARANAEVSGLAWHGDDLILMPQHPFRMSGRVEYGTLYALSRQQIDAYLAGETTDALQPRPITFLAPDLKERSPLYEGCEAIAFSDGYVYLATEAVGNAETGAMRGFLFRGTLHADTLRLDTRRRAALPAQTPAHNMAYEALLAGPGRLAALYESNGRNVNVQPHASVFSSTLDSLGTLDFPTLEYRLTDATTLDADGRFWVTNFYFPGERQKLDPAPDPLAAPGRGTAVPEDSVERLVEFQLRGQAIERTEAAPVRLKLLPDVPRNWEGLVRFESRTRGPGFLIITDQYPETLLGFVPAPGTAASRLE